MPQRNTKMGENLAAVFAEFQEFLEKEQELKDEIRNIVRDLEQKMREVLATMQQVHQPEGSKKAVEICQKARSMLGPVREQIEVLKAKVPEGQYYRYHDHWRFVLQRLCFIGAFIVYLESESLVKREEVADLLGVKVMKDEGFHLDLDDFLMGLLLLANELSRLSVNAVTGGDYGMPVKIARFVGELDAGFRLLNLKNDGLRKRFDGLKYDLKKVEEVVYDVTIRGLQQSDPEKLS